MTELLGLVVLVVTFAAGWLVGGVRGVRRGKSAGRNAVVGRLIENGMADPSDLRVLGL